MGDALAMALWNSRPVILGRLAYWRVVLACPDAGVGFSKSLTRSAVYVKVTLPKSHAMGHLRQQRMRKPSVLFDIPRHADQEPRGRFRISGLMCKCHG